MCICTYMYIGKIYINAYICNYIYVTIYIYIYIYIYIPRLWIEHSSEELPAITYA